MKILHIEAGRHLYGGAKQVEYLINGLTRLGHQNFLICHPDNPITKGCDPDVIISALPLRGDLDVPALFRIARVIRQHKPDLVHIHSRRGADIWGGLAALWCNTPVVCSRRVDNTEPHWWSKLKYAMYDKVISISHAIKHVLVSQGVPEDRISCVQSAVDTVEYQPLGEKDWFQREFKLMPGERVVACFAQMIERKGQRTLIEATKELLASEAINLRVLIFGQGPELDTYQRLVDKHGLGHIVAFPGFRHDVKRILPNVDVVAHPASKEGLGVILLQSSACGVPMVAGKAGGIPEVVDDNRTGYLITPGDVASLTQRLVTLLSDEALRQSFATAARQKAVDCFSVDTMVKGNEAVYQQVLENRYAMANS